MFDRQMCVYYAEKWANSRNPQYYDFTYLGGDCTNFVSQCLHFGGIPMTFSEYGWFYVSLNDRAPAWTGVEEFWNYGTKNRGAGLKITPCNKEDLQIADVVQLGGVRYYHSLIVTKIENGFSGKEIYVSAHDGNAFNRPLNQYVSEIKRYGKIYG